MARTLTEELMNGKVEAAGLFLLLRRALHHSLALVVFGRNTRDGV